MSGATLDDLDLVAEILAEPPAQYEVLLPVRPPAPIRIAMRAAADLEPILRHPGGPEVWQAVHHVARRLRQRAEEFDAAAEAMAAVWERPTLGELRRREVTQ